MELDGIDIDVAMYETIDALLRGLDVKMRRLGRVGGGVS